MTTFAELSPIAEAVLLLDAATLACTARGDTTQGVLADLATWHVDAIAVVVAADTLRAAATVPLPELPDLDPFPSGGDPLELMLAARDALDQVPDDLDSPTLFVGRLRLHDAVAAVRTHYE